MSLDFPTTLRLREDEQRAVLELVKREPLIAKTTMCTGLLLVGLRQVLKSAAGFQELLGLLRLRAQGAQGTEVGA